MKKIKDFKPTYQVTFDSFVHTYLKGYELCSDRFENFREYIGKQIKEIEISYGKGNEIDIGSKECLVCSIRKSQLDIHEFNLYSIGKK